MSFRLRVLGLVALVAVTATAATAWLVLRQASQQVTESQTADRAVTTRITEELTGYGHRHGTWEGVSDLVRTLGFETGQRIRVVADGDVVVADTDHLAGQAARGVPGPALSVDPRPVLTLPAGSDNLAVITVAEIDAYRRGVLLAACLTRAGTAVAVTHGPHGVPRYAPEAAVSPTAATCLEEIDVDPQLPAVDLARADGCLRPTGQPVVGATPLPSGGPFPTGAIGDPPTPRECLRRVFTERVSDLAPVPLRVYVGAVNQPPAALSVRPVLVAAGLVALLAVVSSWLLSQRVLRPIGALTSASRRLGEGDLSERVPVAGRDELAGLARSFNRMADSLQRGEERQRRLVADAAHELRTPLANLRGYLEALKDGVVAPDHELFASLHEEAVLQQRIVDDLQDLALAEAGSLVYHRSDVDLAELLETCRTAHQAVADAGGVGLVAVVHAPARVSADPDRLRQVLGNLVANALRATTGGGTVTLAVGTSTGAAVLTVADTGTGIPPDHLPYVFDRFWRADAARGRSTGGSGLGLAIARQIVTDHGGTISVASEVGVGTTFTIRLPLLA